MSPERVAHTETKGEAYSALKNAIAVAKAPCRALTEGAAVRIDAGTVFEPDVLVYCGPRLPADLLKVPSPVIVVEAPSPWRSRAGSRQQARRLFLAAERHALSPPRRRSRKGGSSQARPRRYPRDADLERRRAAARSAGPRGRGRELVCAAMRLGDGAK